MTKEKLTQEAKLRIARNLYTTIFGALLMLGAAVMYFLNRVPEYEIEFTWLEMVSTALLGWVFLWAKNSLLKGISMGIFNIKEKE